MMERTIRWRPIVIWPSWGFCVALIAFQAVVDPQSLWWIYVPFAASVVVLGLPHGALDHLVLLRQRRQNLALRPVTRIVIEYVSLAALALAVWVVAPVLAFFLFILITWFHWGQGDLHSLLQILGVSHLQSRWQRALTVVVRGGLPMFVPLLAFPSVYASVASGLIEWFDPGVQPSVSWITSKAFRIGGAATFAAIAIPTLIAGWIRSRRARAGWFVDAGETMLLAAYFSFVHPVMAIGIYFCFWHATRHFARLIETDPVTRKLSRNGRWPRIIAHLATRAAPTTVAALGIGVIIYALAPVHPQGPFALLGLYLVLIAILTVPHVWIVCRMDIRERIWSSFP